MKKFLIMLLVFSLALSSVAFAEKKEKLDEPIIKELKSSDITYTSELMDDGSGRYEVKVTIMKHGQLETLAIKKKSNDLDVKSHVVVEFMGDYTEYYEFPTATNNTSRGNREDETLMMNEDGNYVVTFQLNSNFDDFKIFVNMTAGKSKVNFRRDFRQSTFPKVILEPEL